MNAMPIDTWIREVKEGVFPGRPLRLINIFNNGQILRFRYETPLSLGLFPNLVFCLLFPWDLPLEPIFKS
jgi:hypothetical protein